MSQYGVQCLLKEIFEESGQAEDTAAYNKYLKINFFRHKKNLFAEYHQGVQLWAPTPCGKHDGGSVMVKSCMSVSGVV